MNKNVPPLVQNFMEKCTMLDRTRVPDGLGGSSVSYRDGAAFYAAIVKERSVEAEIAEREGVKAIYKVTTSKGVGLEYHEVFRRERDKAVFRITSDSADTNPPEIATFSFEQVTAERWEIPG